MSMMVLAISSLADGGIQHHEKITTLPVVVGRSPGCDVIVADIYIAPRQYILRASEGAAARWEICALDGVNPTLHKGHILPVGQWVAVDSGDVINAGETVVTLYAPDHVVAPAQPLPQQGGIWGALARMPVAALLFIAVLAMTAGWSYLEIWSSEAAMTAAMSVSAVFVIVTIWASLWAVVGRLLTHRSRFALQVSLGCIYVAASLVLGIALRGIDFLFSGNLVSEAATLLTQTVLLAVLIYACLAAATPLPARKRLQGAIAFACGLMISIVSLSTISNMGFSSVPPITTTLSPSLARFAPAVDAGQFIDDSVSLFEDVAVKDKTAAPPTP